MKELAAQGFTGTALGDASYQGDKLRTGGQEMGSTIQTKVCGHKGTFIPTEIR